MHSQDQYIAGGTEVQSPRFYPPSTVNQEITVDASPNMQFIAWFAFGNAVESKISW